VTSGQERDALLPVLEDFGVPRDGVLVVHSAIGSLSRNGFRAEAIIEALLDHLVDGSLFMPTMTWRTVTPAQPVWDEVLTASHTGALTELFRTHYASARSIHPTHSVAGCGPAARTLLARHHIDDTPVSGNSPYGLMRDYQTFILLLGVGLECCTAIHLAEETIAPDLYLQPKDHTEAYECRDRTGTSHRVLTRRHRRLDRHFPRFAPRLAQRRLLKSGEIAGCSYAIVAMRDLLREIFTALIHDKTATLRRVDALMQAVSRPPG
jgi:aminoglycoside 3-N-acetyltransferase